MKFTKNLNSLSESEFTSIFGSVFEKSKWISIETFKQKPFRDPDDLIEKMVKIYNTCSREKIIEIFNLHPKLAIEKKLTGFSSKEQNEAQLDKCSKEELLEFDNLNSNYKKKFKFPFIIAVKGKNKNDILQSFRTRIDNDFETEFNEAKIQVMNIALLRLKEILNKILK